MADQFDHIDAYLKNELSKNEKKMFEQQMSKDPSLANAVQQQQEAIKLVEALGDNELKSQIKSAINQRSNKTTPVRKLSIRWQTVVSIAASFLVLAVAVWFLFSKPSNDALFASNYEVYNLNVNSRDNNIDQNIREAVSLYQEARFEEALSQFETIYTSTNDSKWLIAQAVSLIETNQYQNAIDQLTAVRSNADDVYQGPALWYTAMAHLKLNQKEEAMKNIELLSRQESGAYANKAKKFLEKK